MKATDLMEQYLKLNEQEKTFFLHSLSAHLLLNLADGEFLMVTKSEFRKINHEAEMYKHVRELVEG